jgi:hypothetical protein
MSLGKLKAFLTLLMALGAVAYFGGDGTLASFSAETANPGSTIASGTLTMSNTVNSGTACLSSSGTGASNNVNSSCDKLFTITNVAPGVYAGVAQVTVKNTGSLNASKLWVWAPTTSSTLTTALTSGTSYTTLAVTALKSAIVAGQGVVVSSGTHSQTFYASAAAAANATSISVTSQAASFSYPVGSNVDVNDCYDQTTTSAPSGAPSGTTYGSQLNFNTTAGNPMCGAMVMYVQETGQVSGSGGTTSYSYCWLGNSSGQSLCVAPISVTLSSSVTSSSTALPVSALNGNVKSGDTIVVTKSDGSTLTFAATQDVTFGATSIPVGSGSGTGTATSGSTVSDTSSLGTLDADTTNTITNFDTSHNSRVGPVQLAQVTANGTLGNTGLTQLASGASRTFEVGILLPAPTGGIQNNLQGLFSTFGLTWHIDQ